MNLCKPVVHIMYIVDNYIIATRFVNSQFPHPQQHDTLLTYIALTLS